MKVLQEDVEHHVEEEQDELFPKVEKLFDAETLEAIGEAMEETQAELISAGNPRDADPERNRRRRAHLTGVPAPR